MGTVFKKQTTAWKLGGKKVPAENARGREGHDQVRASGTAP